MFTRASCIASMKEGHSYNDISVESSFDSLFIILSSSVLILLPERAARLMQSTLSCSSSKSICHIPCRDAPSLLFILCCAQTLNARSSHGELVLSSSNSITFLDTTTIRNDNGKQSNSILCFDITRTPVLKGDSRYVRKIPIDRCKIRALLSHPSEIDVNSILSSSLSTCDVGYRFTNFQTPEDLPLSYLHFFQYQPEETTLSSSHFKSAIFIYLPEVE